ncbi:MAG: hypothetical protein NTW29_19540 [Bacteroidetes bacterium]|nr:hypothetical protein [Bacteroidota bacterium]
MTNQLIIQEGNKMKKNLIVLVLLVIIFKNIANSQSLKFLGLHKSNYNSALRVTEYPDINILIKNEDTSSQQIFIHGHKQVVICKNANLFIEIFESQYLVISENSPKVESNGQPNFLRPRRRVYFTEISPAKKRKNIYFFELDNKRILSNGFELGSIKISDISDYILKEIDVQRSQVSLFNINSNEIENFQIKKVKRKLHVICSN